MIVHLLSEINVEFVNAAICGFNDSSALKTRRTFLETETCEGVISYTMALGDFDHRLKSGQHSVLFLRSSYHHNPYSICYWSDL